MYEVFDYRSGQPVVSVPFAWLARTVAHLCGRGYDYAARGEGWIQ